MATKAIEPVCNQLNTRYKARVRVTYKGKTLAQCCRTFDTYPEAKRWVDRVAKIADREGAEGLKRLKSNRTITVGDVILMILNNEPTAQNLGRSKKSNLKMLLKYPIASTPLESLTATVLYEHCKLRRQSVKPQSVSHDISNLCTALRDAKTFFGVPSDTSIFNDARSSLQRHGFIARSEARHRRLMSGESEKVTASLKVKSISSKGELIPLLEIFELAVEMGLRLGEISRIQGNDICKRTRTLTVHQRKSPNKRKKHTNVIPLTHKAMNILIKRQQTEGGKLFPYSPNTIGTNWRKLTKELGIHDLHFHDLRTEAACRMFEAGMNVVEISKITGHQDLNVLNKHYLPLCTYLPEAA
ncbi:tyrosine-type recombinase/integrase [Vibrio astriarenae]|uniref:Tyrosine-type recombinase/integrase n=1 Tax=Vibrio astriarenae TaxID=1481923 RepID=A0A7Z2T4U1_9VIBR|nr:site-specific integrase [Vibrio astriarenae]QIA64332.1 tyrosine-type recombinase/integrase [Vibrio astriarenae]